MASFVIDDVLTLGTNGAQVMADWTIARNEDWRHPIVESLNDTVNLRVFRTPLYVDAGPINVIGIPGIPLPILPRGRLVTDCTGISCRVRVKYGDTWSKYFILTPVASIDLQ